MQLENVKAQVKGQLTPLSDLTNFNDHKEITKVSTKHNLYLAYLAKKTGVHIFMYSRLDLRILMDH